MASRRKLENRVLTFSRWGRDSSPEKTELRRVSGRSGAVSEGCRQGRRNGLREEHSRCLKVLLRGREEHDPFKDLKQGHYCRYRCRELGKMGLEQGGEQLPWGIW